jgi:hypothetical protein
VREDSPTLHWSSITLARHRPRLRLSTRTITLTHATHVTSYTCADSRRLRLSTRFAPSHAPLQPPLSESHFFPFACRLTPCPAPTYPLVPLRWISFVAPFSLPWPLWHSPTPSISPGTTCASASPLWALLPVPCTVRASSPFPAKTTKSNTKSIRCAPKKTFHAHALFFPTRDKHPAGIWPAT